MTVKIEIDDREVKATLKKLIDKESKKIILSALLATGNSIKGTIVTRIDNVNGRKGKWRLFRGQGKNPYYVDDKPEKPRKLDWNMAIRASAEGEYPVSNTGNLTNSMVVEPSGDMTVKVIAKAKYAWYLENDLKRPFMQLALMENKDELARNMDLAMDKIMRHAK